MLFITPTKGRSQNPKFFLQFQETSNKMSQKDPNTIDDKTEPKALLSDNEPNRSVNENFENNSGSKDQPENHKNRDDIKLLCGSNIIYSKRTIEKCEKHIKRKIKLSNILLLVLTLEDLPQLVLQSSLYFKEGGKYRENALCHNVPEYMRMGLEFLQKRSKSVQERVRSV